MEKRPALLKLSRATAAVTWAVVTGCALWIAFADERLAERAILAIPVALANFGAIWYAGREDRCDSVFGKAALAVQLISGLAMGAVLPISFMPIYTVIWIAMAADAYSYRAIGWLFAFTLVAWFLIMRYLWGDTGALLSTMLYGTFHLFALLSSVNAREAAEARDALRTTNRELLATQHLLSEAARQSERSRIARDLHDLLGHHLTALSIKLQIAERKSTGEIRDIVADSRGLARLLLADVRDAVSAVRERNDVDIKSAIDLLADGAPGLEVTVDIEDGLAVDNVDVAESLVRCVQEAITNTLRHAGADRCSIRLRQIDDRVVLDVRDNGTAPPSLVEGNGLMGMRERLQRVRGLLTIDTAEGGVRLRAEIPAETA